MRAAPAVLAAAIACVPAAASGFDAQQLMQLLAAVPSSRAQFVETRQSAMLKKPLVASGRLVYRRPDRLEKHIEAPFNESITIEGDRVTIARAGSGAQAERVVTLPAGSPVQALVGGLRATLAGDLAALERHFVVSVSGERGDWTMTLTPRDAALAAAVSRVEIAGRGERLQRVDVLETGGDRSVTVIGDEAR